MAKLRNRLIAESVLLNVMTALILGAVVYFASFTYFMEDFQRDKLSFVNAVSMTVNGDVHRRLLSSTDQNDPQYQEILTSLSHLKGRESDVIYVYTINQSPSGLVYAVDGSVYPHDILWVENPLFAYSFWVDKKGALQVSQNAEVHDKPFTFRDEGQAEHLVAWKAGPGSFDVTFDGIPLCHIVKSTPLKITLPDQREVLPGREIQVTDTGPLLTLSLSLAGTTASPPGSTYVDSPENLAHIQDVFRSAKEQLIIRSKPDIYGVKMTVYSPVLDASKKVAGVMVFDFSDHEISEIERNLFLIVFSIVTLSFLITAIWSLILSRSFTKPILLIQNAIKKVENGDLKPDLPIKRKDEFGQLAISFHAMLQALRLTMEEREKIHHQLLHQSRHDDLTGLPNKKAFLEALEDAILHARRGDGSKFKALLLLSLDVSKTVNDTLGRAAADLILKMAYQRVRGQIRQTDLFFRLDGEEFSLILNALNKEEDAAIVAEKVILAIQSPFRIEDQIVHISSSMGIAIMELDGTSADFLLRSADTALTEAKKHRNYYRFFTTEMQQRAEERLRLINNLHRAVKGQEFVPYYQIQVNQQGEIIGAEALVRWFPPQGPMVGPNLFIPLAEETNLIVPLGKNVIEQTCRTLRKIRDHHGLSLSLAVNLSFKQFQNDDLIPFLLQTLAQFGLFPADLDLEITESTLAEEHHTVKQLEYLRHQGFTILVDDFGTGYSSLARLKKLPLDILKIDKMFVDGLPHDKTDRELVASIIALAHMMKLTVIAEGVENEDQVRCLVDMGCDAFQGYYFSKPVPEDQFLALLGTKFKVL